MTLCRTGIACAVLACSDAIGPSDLTVSAVAGSEGQRAETGGSLPLPLRVRVVSNGVPREGVLVKWRASAGTIDDLSLTDANGQASASWTLGPVAGPMTVTTTVADAQGSPVTFHATALGPRTKSTMVPASNEQTGVVGTALSQPLQVRVDSGGSPKAGVIIHWHTGSGSVSPETSVSGLDGLASTTWTLGTVSGARTADATVEGAPPVLVFVATALPGPAANIEATNGSGQTMPANHGAFSPLQAIVTDQYGNRIEGEAVTWTIRNGPVTFIRADATTDESGQSSATVYPSGAQGQAVVRAAIPGSAATADFTLTITHPDFGVVLHTTDLLTNGPFAFVSSQNGTRSPAVDTIPAGKTMTWTLQFDYDQHGVKSVGSPSFQGGDFPYSAIPTISVKFDTPGTYAYEDPYWPGVTGILVVQ